MTPDQTSRQGCPVRPATTGRCPVSHRAEAFDPFGSDYQLDPAEALRWARDEAPVFFAPKLGYWVVSRYDDVKAVFRDNILFSPAIALEKITPAPPEAQAILQRYGYAMNRTMVNEDEPAHMERRRLLTDAFLPERLERHKPMVRALTRQYMDRFIERGHADLVGEMFWEIPLIVALKFLGVDEDDIEDLKSFSVAHTVNTWGRPSPAEQLSVADAVGRFWQASGRVLEKMRANPNGEGWMYDSIRMNHAYPDIVTDSYLHSMMMAILVAAHETTAKAAGNAFRVLLSDAAAWREIVANPGLIPNAVEECLRLAGSVVAWRRITTAEARIGGVDIPAGARLLIVTASANHDERHFEDPDELNLYRDNAVEHLTFGYGGHQCMGKNIARMELRIFLEEFSRRLPHMRLVAGQSFDYLPNTSFRGPDAVLVEWNPAANPERGEAAVPAVSRDFPVGPPAKADLQRPALVVEARASGGVLHLALEDPTGRGFPKWRPGAHVELTHGGYSRKYSLCGEPDASGRYQVAILKEENGTGGSAHFHQTLVAGTVLRIAGPRNHFRLDETADRYVLVAGGIGITPILAMADRLKALGKPYVLHYAGRSRRAMALLERAERDHAGRLSVYARSEGGRLDLAAALRDLPQGAQVYGCGPKRLLDELDALAAGWPDNTLHVEHFSAGETTLDPSVEHAFAAHLRDSGITVSVGADQTLLDALIGAGIDISCDCREGLCGTCEVVAVEGGIDHRDKVLSRAERAEGRRLMSCCSRASGDSIVLAL